MRAIRHGRGRERREKGSALLISLMMVFIMTILGLALFDLGVIENRLTSANEADARALEIANAGLERAYRIQLSNMTSSNSLANLGFSDTVFFFSTVVNRPFLGDPGRPGGSYSLEFMNVKVTQGASPPSGATDAPFGQPCIQDPSPLFLNPVCADLLFVRSRGSLGGSAGALATGESPSSTYGRVRAVQTLVRAESLSPFAYAVTAQTQGPNQIRGLIAGSIHFLLCVPAQGCTTPRPFGFDSSSLGQQNHYFELDSTSRDRIAPLQRVCAVGAACGTRVYSLGATLRVAEPRPGAVVTARSLGESSNTLNYTHDGVPSPGKGPLDNVFVADGCNTAACTDNYTLTDGAAVNVSDGNITKPYPQRPPRSFPRLTDPVTIGGNDYQHYACLAGCGSATQFVTSSATTTGHGGGGWSLTPIPGCSVAPCPSPGSPIAAGTIATAFPGLLGATSPGVNVCDGTALECAALDLGAALGSATGGLDFANTRAFIHDFVFTDATGPSNGATPNRQGRICWTGPSGTPPRTLRFATSATTGLGRLSDQVPLTTQVALRTGANCTPVGSVTIATTAVPLLVLIDAGSATTRGFWLRDAGGSVPTLQYEGAAIFVVNGTVDIEGILQTVCTIAPCLNQKFPDNYMLAILSSGDMSVGAGDPMNRPSGFKNGLDRVMALLYTEGSFFSAGASGVGSRNIIIGTVAARTFCFAKGCAGSGASDETRLFQAGLRVFPDELLPGRNRWAIALLQKFWRECVPLTVTPTYTFSPGRCPY